MLRETLTVKIRRSLGESDWGLRVKYVQVGMKHESEKGKFPFTNPAAGSFSVKVIYDDRYIIFGFFYFLSAPYCNNY